MKYSERNFKRGSIRWILNSQEPFKYFMLGVERGLVFLALSVPIALWIWAGMKFVEMISY
jgi:hypothetical protein